MKIILIEIYLVYWANYKIDVICRSNTYSIGTFIGYNIKCLVDKKYLLTNMDKTREYCPSYY